MIFKGDFQRGKMQGEATVVTYFVCSFSPS